MDNNPAVVNGESATPIITPVAYHRLYGRSLMVLTKLRATAPESDELCRITAVNTLPPGLWITARFLNGTTRSFRPETIQLADAAAEEQERTLAV